MGKDLQMSGGAADASTVVRLLRLLKVLSKPEGPRVLMGAIQRDHPALFTRLHESMKRTVQRKQGGYDQEAATNQARDRNVAFPIAGFMEQAARSDLRRLEAEQGEFNRLD